MSVCSCNYVLIRLAETTSKLSRSQQTSSELGSKLEEVQLGRSSAESALTIEKQRGSTLQVCGVCGTSILYVMTGKLCS